MQMPFSSCSRRKSSCVTKASRAQGKKVVTIVGVSAKHDHPLQKAWLELDVSQCGYCQAGQIMSAAVLLKDNKIQRMRILMMRWPVIFVAAAPICVSGMLSS